MIQNQSHRGRMVFLFRTSKADLDGVSAADRERETSGKEVVKTERKKFTGYRDRE